jgi:hypothetical protein
VTLATLSYVALATLCFSRRLLTLLSIVCPLLPCFERDYSFVAVLRTRLIFSIPEQDRLRRMSALVTAAGDGDVTEVLRLLREGASLSEVGGSGRTAMYMALDGRHTPVVKCLIKEGGADIDAMIFFQTTAFLALFPEAITSGNPTLTATVIEHAIYTWNYVLAKWLIEEGACIPLRIWQFLKFSVDLKHADAEELSSFLKVLILLPLSPEQDRCLPAFVAKLSPQYAEICTRGRQLRDRLATYLEQQRALVGKHLPVVLECMVAAYTMPTPEELWSDDLEWLDSADNGDRAQ